MGKYVLIIYTLGILSGAWITGVTAQECIKSNFIYGICEVWK